MPVNFIRKILLLLLGISVSLEGADPFVVVTAERSGTHLLTRALSFLTGKKVYHLWDRTEVTDVLEMHLDTVEKEGKFFHMHAFPEQNIKDLFHARGYKVIFLLRDPRDQLLSVLHYIRDVKWEYEQLQMTLPFGELSIDEQIEEMITGQRYGICVPKEFIWKRLPWMELQDPPSFTARFENLVGIKGGGSRDIQIIELTKLADYLNIDISNEKIEEIADDLFGGDGLRNGQISSWKSEFNENHKALFKIHFGEELIQLGYELNFDW